MPRLVVDPTVAAAQVVIGLRTIASRNVHCSKAPSLASPRSMAAAGKSFPKPVAAWDKPFIHSSVRDQIGCAIRRIATEACACGAEMELRYERRYPPTVNAAPETEIAATAAASLVGESDVRRDLLPSVGAEDFACSLKRKPAAYI